VRHSARFTGSADQPRRMSRASHGGARLSSRHGHRPMIMRKPERVDADRSSSSGPKNERESFAETDFLVDGGRRDSISEDADEGVSGLADAPGPSVNEDENEDGSDSDDSFDSFDYGDGVNHESISHRLNELFKSLRAAFNRATTKCIVGTHETLASLHPHFSDVAWVGPELRSIFTNASDPRTLAPGETLITEGELQPYVHLLLQGTLVLYKDINGKVAEVGKLHPGAIVGDISFLLGSPPGVTVQARARP
jgi:hypothetical protein